MPHIIKNNNLSLLISQEIIKILFGEKLKKREILTTENGPRGGRSGGGVMTDDYQLIFICSRGGGGYGYWSSLHQIHKFDVSTECSTYKTQ